jgi:glycosyltransferase involved in cell wall biosynthesis
MKILYVEPIADSFGHEGEYAAKLCQSLFHAGHEVILCTNRFHWEKYLQIPPGFRVIEVGGGSLALEKYLELRNQWPIVFWYAFLRNSGRVLLHALKLMKKEMVDIVYIIDTDRVVMAVLLRLWSLLIGYPAPIVLEIHAANFDVPQYNGGHARKLWKLVQVVLLKRVLGKEIKAIHALGEYHVRALTEQLSLDLRAIRVVAITEGTEVREDACDKLAARSKLGLPSEPAFLILMFGTIRKDKGVELALQALSRVQAQGAKLILVGSPLEYSATELEDRIVGERAKDSVICRFAYVSEDDMFLYFCAADAVVLPYRYFYQGGVGPLRKACAAGKLLIASEVADMGRIVKVNRMGLTFKPDDLDSLAEQLRKALGMSTEERALYEENARSFARRNTWHSMASQLATLFGEVIGGA